MIVTYYARDDGSHKQDHGSYDSEFTDWTILCKNVGQHLNKFAQKALIAQTMHVAYSLECHFCEGLQFLKARQLKSGSLLWTMARLLRSKLIANQKNGKDLILNGSLVSLSLIHSSDKHC